MALRDESEHESIGDEHDDENDELLSQPDSESDLLDISTDELDADDDDDDDGPEPPRARGRRRPPVRRTVRGRDNTTMWFTSPDPNPNPVPAGLIRSRAAGASRNLIDPVSIFRNLITSELIDLILQFTNQRILTSRGSRSHMEAYETRVATREEIAALMGLLFFSGLMRTSMVRVEELWANSVGPAIFAATLSTNRFQFLLRALRFDDIDTRQQRRAADRFALFRDLWNMFINNCQANYELSSYVTVDETMLAFHGRCGFIIYIPSKPDRYGLKIISLSDATSSYFYNGYPYVGRENQGNLTIPTQQALRVLQPIFNTRRNVTVDNYFCSNQLADALIQNGMTVVGTMRKSRREIPSRMLRARRTDVGQSRFLYMADRILVSHIPKPRKAVVVLSTAHVERGKVDDNGKPAIINFYNRTKGGVDTLNQMLHSKSTYRKTRRWTVRYFFGILDIAALNAYIIHKSNGGNLTRHQFLKQLSQQLVIPHAQWRLTNDQISRGLRVKIRQFLGMPLDEPLNDQPRRTGRPTTRCKDCPRRNDRKATLYCYRCGGPICAQHRRGVCVQCYQNRN